MQVISDCAVHNINEFYLPQRLYNCSTPTTGSFPGNHWGKGGGQYYLELSGTQHILSLWIEMI